MALLTEPNQVGKREDLSNVIAIVDAHSTPFTSMAPKGPKLKNSDFSYQVDSYRDPRTTGVVDGVDVTSFNNKAANRQRLHARVQKWRDSWQVSDLSENLSDPAGLKSEMAGAIAHCLVEVKRDMEATFCSDNDSQDDDGTDSYHTRSLGSWINNSAQGHLPVPTAYRTPSASIDSTAMASLTETIVNNVLESVWTQTGQNMRYTFLVGTKLKRRITDLTVLQTGVVSETAAIRSFNQDGASKKVVATVDVYEGDFGTLELHASNWLAYGADDAGTTSGTTRRGYVLDPNRYKIRMLRDAGSFRLEDKGGGPRGYVDAVGALVYENPLGGGKFAATS